MIYIPIMPNSRIARTALTDIANQDDIRKTILSVRRRAPFATFQPTIGVLGSQL